VRKGASSSMLYQHCRSGISAVIMDGEQNAGDKRCRRGRARHESAHLHAISVDVIVREVELDNSAVYFGPLYARIWLVIAAVARHSSAQQSTMS